jgi:hypothetical protein
LSESSIESRLGELVCESQRRYFESRRRFVDRLDLLLALLAEERDDRGFIAAILAELGRNEIEDLAISADFALDLAGFRVSLE